MEIIQHPQFARHETFPPRTGWFRKGFEEVRYGNSFLGEDAQVRLGVGKNMVTAIRYWTMAFGLAQFPILGNGELQPTQLATSLFDDSGVDPYFESTTTAWWLHWKLLRNWDQATSWHFAFSVFRKLEFTAEELENEIFEFANTHFPTKNVARSSIKKDAQAIIRMYTARTGSKLSVEDVADSPFHVLNLVLHTGEKGVYRFNIGRKDNLPDSAIAAACLEFAEFSSPGTSSISLNSLMYDQGSPGKIFRIPEAQIEDAIENTSHLSGCRLMEGAGSVRLILPTNKSDSTLLAYGKAA